MQNLRKFSHKKKRYPLALIRPPHVHAVRPVRAEDRGGPEHHLQRAACTYMPTNPPPPAATPKKLPRVDSAPPARHVPATIPRERAVGLAFAYAGPAVAHDIARMPSAPPQMLQ